MNDKNCKNCNFSSGEVKLICGNDKSDNYTDYVDLNMSCDCWEKSSDITEFGKFINDRFGKLN